MRRTRFTFAALLPLLLLGACAGEAETPGEKEGASPVVEGVDPWVAALLPDIQAVTGEPILEPKEIDPPVQPAGEAWAPQEMECRQVLGIVWHHTERRFGLSYRVRDWENVESRYVLGAAVRGYFVHVSSLVAERRGLEAEFAKLRDEDPEEAAEPELKSPYETIEWAATRVAQDRLAEAGERFFEGLCGKLGIPEAVRKLAECPPSRVDELQRLDEYLDPRGPSLGHLAWQRLHGVLNRDLYLLPAVPITRVELTLELAPAGLDTAREAGARLVEGFSVRGQIGQDKPSVQVQLLVAKGDESAAKIEETWATAWRTAGARPKVQLAGFRERQVRHGLRDLLVFRFPRGRFRSEFTMVREGPLMVGVTLEDAESYDDDASSLAIRLLAAAAGTGDGTQPAPDIESGDWQARWLAIRKMPGFAEQLATAVRDPDPRVRARGCWRFARSRGEVSFPDAPLEPLLSDPMPEVRAGTILALGKGEGILPESMQKMLYLALKDADPQVRDAALPCLKKRVHPQAYLIVAFLKACRDPAAAARKTAVERMTVRLQELPGPVPDVVLAELTRLLDDPDPKVTRAVNLALEKLGAGK